MLRDARAALKAGEFDRAETLAAQISTGSPEWIAAGLLAGEAAVKGGRETVGLTHYLAVAASAESSKEAAEGYYYAGEVYRSLGRLDDAVGAYYSFLERSPDNAAAHERLAFLLSAAGRRWESIPHYFWLVRSGSASLSELVVFGDPDRPVEQRAFLEECARKSPQDRLARLGLAAHDFWDGDAPAALGKLQAILLSEPDSVPAQAMLGELLVNAEDRQFADWERGLPAAANKDPDIWYVRGLRARKHNQLRAAARCFWQATRIAPIHRRANYQLGQVLNSLGEPGSREFEHLAQLQIELTQSLDQILRSDSKNQAAMQRTAEILEQTGRVWEACAWGVLARRQFPDSEWPSEVFARLSGKLLDGLPQTIAAADLAQKFDFSGFPEFSSAIENVPERVHSSVSQSAIRFAAESDGPEFTYWNGADPETPGARQFEQTGGGVGVLDFDVDGWPDLFFPQGLDWRTGSMVPEASHRFSDGLFRNRGGEGWDDMSASAGLRDTGFGQGCAAGDFDNDGFPDLYVANVGRNQLLHNNGDGTFSDVTEVAGLKHLDWTASCVIVDLNADGFSDLYDVNYLTGRGVYEAICQKHACSPSVFDGVEDRILISRGDGTFEPASRLTPEVDGKGLGVVAFDLLQRGRPSLFIANDQVPNFLLQNRATDHRDRVRFDDEGFPAGVAFNQDGLAMASMGIAADDADGDGRIDFYVSTFKDEGSTLFLQSSPGLFVESANTAGLKGPTFPFVGWGAQFLDADLDGWPDLVGVNGHVDDYRDEGGEYHMRPQFFRNLGGARFEELQGSDVGSFFAQPRLGRGLARLDWNRDGRMDFAVSHIGDRAGLATNDTAQAGHFLNVRLSARTTARDAIGATVEVVAGDRRWTKQLVAGDGYMASNERLLQFGLGSAETATRVKVEWLSGTTSEVHDVPADRTLELIEQSPRAILREHPERSEVIATVTGHAE